MSASGARLNVGSPAKRRPPATIGTAADANEKAAQPSSPGLVVGHSETVADMARALGDPAPQPITECDFDKMTVIQLDGPTAPPKTLPTR